MRTPGMRAPAPQGHARTRCHAHVPGPDSTPTPGATPRAHARCCAPRRLALRVRLRSAPLRALLGAGRTPSAVQGCAPRSEGGFPGRPSGYRRVTVRSRRTVAESRRSGRSSGDDDRLRRRAVGAGRCRSAAVPSPSAVERTAGNPGVSRSDARGVTVFPAPVVPGRGCDIRPDLARMTGRSCPDGCDPCRFTADPGHLGEACHRRTWASAVCHCSSGQKAAHGSE